MTNDDNRKPEVTYLTFKDISLSSIVMPSGRVPSTVVVLKDDSPLFSNYQGRYIVSDVKYNRDEPEVIELLFHFSSENNSETDLPEGVELPQFSITLPLHYAQQAHATSMIMNGPSFVFISENESVGTYLEDFTHLVDFPESNDENFHNVLNILSYATTGTLMTTLDVSDLNNVRAAILSIIMKLVQGDSSGYMKILSYINPVNDFSNQSANSSWAPDEEEKKISLLLSLLKTAQEETHPTTLRSALAVEDDTDDYLSNLEEFENIMSHAELDKVFSSIMKEESPSKEFIPTSESSEAQKFAYLSSPLTLDNLPGKLANLKPQLKNFSLLWRMDWNNLKVEEFQDKSISSGEVMAALFITIAARVIRLAQIDASEDKISTPALIVARILSIPDEAPFWALVETAKLLADEEAIPFESLVTCMVPVASEPIGILQSPLGALLHRLGHLALEEEWKIDILDIAFKDLPLIQGFMQEAYSITAEQDSEEETGPKPCGPAQAALNLIALGFEVRDIIIQLSGAMLILAELNAMKHTDFSKGSTLWSNYTKDYLGKLVIGPQEA